MEREFLLGSPEHIEVWETLVDVGFGRGVEADFLVETACLILGMDLDGFGVQTLDGEPQTLADNHLAVTFASLGCYDAPDGDVWYVGHASWAYSEHGDNLIAARQPGMDADLVVEIEILIDAVLLVDEDLAADMEERV